MRASQNAELIRLAFEVRHRVSQTLIWSRAPSCSDSSLTWNAKLLRLALVGTQSYSHSRRTQACSSPRLKSPYFLGREVRISVQNATFALKWGSRLITCPRWFLDSLQRESYIYICTCSGWFPTHAKIAPCVMPPNDIQAVSPPTSGTRMRTGLT